MVVLTGHTYQQQRLPVGLQDAAPETRPLPRATNHYQ